MTTTPGAGGKTDPQHVIGFVGLFSPLFFPALLITALVFLSGCNTHTRISNENAIAIMQAQQQLADKLLHDPEVQTALDGIESEPLTTIEDIKHIAESGEKALKPVRDMLAIESTFLGIGDPEPVEADVTVEQIIDNAPKAMGLVDFRTKLAEEEVKHHPRKRWQQTWATVTGGIMATIMAAISAYFGLSKYRGIKQSLQNAVTEAGKHRTLAKNSVHYAKDVEAIMTRGDLTPEQRAIEIERIRERSAKDQLKHGITDTMDSVMGEVKRERKAN